MPRRSVIALALAGATGAALLAPGLGLAGGSPSRTDWGMRISVVGPGSISSPGFIFGMDNAIDQRPSSLTRTVTITPTPQGNGAEFVGWLGACASAGVGPCTVTLVDVNSTECLWAGARFERAGESTPPLADPCESSGGGGNGGGGGNAGGGGSSGGGASGGASGGNAALPAPGTTLQGGATVVKKAPALRGARTSVKGAVVRATGRVPAGTTRVVQSLVFNGKQGGTAAGKCSIARARGTFTCSAKPPKGRWQVITQAKRGTTVLGQSSAVVTVR